MSSTTMHFGPEWMRTKHQTPTRAQPPPSPPPVSGASTYSALVSPAPPPQPDNRDEAHPFRYTKEELLRIYREGGGKGGLGLEVERWEGVVREIGNEPIGLRELGDSEKKLFNGPLNSDLRRRQSTDFLSPLSTQGLVNDRPRLTLNSPAPTTGSPMRDRFGALRRRDSTDQPSLTIPRKQSLSNLQPLSPRDAIQSPRRGSSHTPGFDGILSGSDSWVSRRRASEASLKASTGMSREGGVDYQLDSKASDIREEEEDTVHKPGGNPRQTDELHSQDNLVGSLQVSKDPSISDDLGATTGMANLSLNNNSGSTLGSLNSLLNIVPVSGTVDLASIEWSYKDPSGQVQGPFNAELMQKWFDDGYFTGNLPMKRTHLDIVWVTVDELVKQHGGTKIFVTPPLSVGPPGLTQPQQFVQDPLLFNGPYQPAPLRNTLSSTLDSFSSNPSDSPSSSFGAGRFGNGSPDPNTFGGRGVYFGDNTLSGRVQGFGGPADASTFNRRNTFNDPSLDPALGLRGPAYGVVPGRVPAADAYSYNRTYSPGQGWNTNNFDASNRGSIDPFSSPFAPAPTNNFAAPQEVFNDSIPFQSREFNNFSGPSQPQNYSPAAQYQQPSSNIFNVHSSTPQTISSDLNSSPAPQSPWNSEARRPGPFDTVHPTSTNATVEALPWGQTGQVSRPGSQVNEASPWLPPSQDLAEESWTTAPGPDSLTFSNVGQHNQQQKQLESATEMATGVPEPVEPPAILPVTETPPVLEPTTKSTPPNKPKGRAAVERTQPPLTRKATETPDPQFIPEPSPPPLAPKPAWSKEDEGKTKPSSVSVSLREIQEAEAKKADARKAAEREKERAARATVPITDTKDASQPFTASWGLPTSHSRITAPPKEPTLTTTPVVTPVWTNASKSATTKKTMKEIQEEEEKRKKNAVKDTVAVAARRAYAESTQKVATPQAASGNVWTTVGPSGKSNTTSAPIPAASSTPARLSINPSTSNLNLSGSSTRPNGNAAPRPISASVSPVVKAAPLVTKSDDPPPPSHEFVKWLSGALKGLNSSVNVEEILHMLLSFPIDPDASVIELIADLIYANSTTLDGRRFAAEYITKRKADAVSRPKASAAAGKASAKPVSIADVVKAAPKPTQPEWGFKVVNKKRKGGRA